MISVLIPLAPGRVLDARIKDALAAQTVENEVYIYCSPIKLSKYEHQAANLNYLKRFAGIPYTMIMSADQIIDNPNTLELLSAELDARPEIDAVTADSKGFTAEDKRIREQETYHVLLDPCLVRTAAIDGITFRSLEPGDCPCKAFNLDIGKGRIVYHPTLTAKEI